MSKLQIDLDQIDNVILDFGGVLFNIDYALPIQAFRSLGMRDFDKLYSQAQQSGLFDELEVGKIDQAGFLEGLRTYFDRPVSDEELLHAWNVILLDIPKHRIDAVHKLKQRFRTFLLSNTNAIHVAEFEKTIDETMGIEYFRSAFEHIYYSNEVGLRKPHTEVYKFVLEQHGLVAERTLFIDDTIRHVEGARKTGLKGHHFVVGEDEVSGLFGV